MATYKVVDADQLDADLKTVADALRVRAGYHESTTLKFPSGFVKAIREIGNRRGCSYIYPSEAAGSLDPNMESITFIEGMTWSEFISSNYNTYGFIEEANFVLDGNLGDPVVDENGNQIEVNSYMTETEYYSLTYWTDKLSY